MKNRKSSNIFFGLVFISIALISLAGALIPNNWHYMSISIIILFSAFGLYSLIKRNFFFATYSFAYALGTYYYNYTVLVALSGWELFFIATALAIGLQLIFGKKRRMTIERSYSYTTTNGRKHNGKHKTSETINSDETYMFIKTQFSGDTRYIYSPNLQEIDIVNQFGGTSIYFQERELLNDLNINLDCQLGAIELYFPKEWNIIDNVSASLAGVDYGPRPYSDITSPYTVSLNGKVQLGGIEINYY